LTPLAVLAAGLISGPAMAQHHPNGGHAGGNMAVGGHSFAGGRSFAAPHATFAPRTAFAPRTSFAPRTTVPRTAVAPHSTFVRPTNHYWGWNGNHAWAGHNFYGRGYYPRYGYGYYRYPYYRNAVALGLALGYPYFGYGYGYNYPYYSGYSYPSNYDYGYSYPYYDGYTYPDYSGSYAMEPTTSAYPPAEAAPAPIPNGSATITVKVPAGAQFWIDGQPTTQTGPVRTFVTPTNLEPGRTYSYHVRAEWVQHGQTVVREKDVSFQAGNQIVIDLTIP
jgi:uncharacterized protein (TIGR03000 family)